MRGRTIWGSTAVCLGLLIGFGPSGILPAADDDKVTSADKIVADENLAGVWDLKTAINQGTKVAAQKVKGSRVIVRENSISVVDRQEKERYRCTYTFDKSSKPWKIDMVSKLPGQPEAKSAGIYKVDGETWTLCYALPGGERPEKFLSPEDSSQMLMKMKRPKNVK